MKTYVIAAVLLATAFPAHAGRPVRDPDRPRDLEVEQLEQFVREVRPDVRECFLRATAGTRATGVLTLELVVHPAGYVERVVVNAPGAPARAVRRLTRCIADEVSGYSFPARRSATLARLPFYFLRVAPPGAGPQPSCWRRTGCRVRSATPSGGR